MILKLNSPLRYSVLILLSVFYFFSIYSSDDEDEDVELYDHDYDGLLPKGGKRHLGKTRWTREEVNWLHTKGL